MCSNLSKIAGWCNPIKGFRNVFILGLWLACSWARAQQPPVYQPVQMQATLAKFKHALEYAHPDLYAHQTKDDFDKLFKTLNEQTSKPLDGVQFHNLVLQMAAHLHDGHTSVFATNQLRTYIYAQPILPFHFLVQHQRIFVTRNMSNLPVADGSEILSINGALSNAIINKLLTYFGGDGLSTSCLEYRFGSGYHSFYQVYPMIFGFASSYRFVVRDYKTKAIYTLQVPCITYDAFRTAEMSKYKNNLHTAGIEEALAQKAFDVSFNTAGNYAYLKISRFFKDDYEESPNVYGNFYRDAFKQINDKKIGSLVIDLRGNGGGVGSNAAELLRYLTDKPFIPTTEISLPGNDQYYKTITTDSLGLDKYFMLKLNDKKRFIVTNTDSILELKEYKPVPDLRFKGKIYVLIDGGSLSAAGMEAGLLRQYTPAVFVEQETRRHARKSNGIRQLSIRGEGTDVTLNIPLLHSEFSVTEGLKTRGTVPDYEIDYNIDDILACKDTALEFVLKRIKTMSS